MKKRVGIPRCLLYYRYFPGWQSFFQSLGAQVVLSPPTNKEIVDWGVKQAVDEVCLPVKLCFGHVEYLKDKVDYIFLPRMISVKRNEWICPKFLGLPDMIRAQVPDLPPLISPDLNLRKSRRQLLQAARNAARPFTGKVLPVFMALAKSLRLQRQYSQELQKGKTPLELLEKKIIKERKDADLVLALLGHPYLIYESYINMDLIAKLRRLGTKLITPEMLNPHLIQRGAAEQSKDLFWTLNKQTLGAANFFTRHGGIDGIVQLASFGCGPDALINELVERQTRRKTEVPILSINIDEHTGEAGLITRIEAFLDMVRLRRQVE